MTRWILLAILFVLVLGSYLVMLSSRNWSEALPLEEVNPQPGVQEQYQSWMEFTSPDSDFKVSFPFEPQNARETAKGRVYNMYVSEKPDGTIYMVSKITFLQLDLQREGAAVLRTIMNEMVSSKPLNELAEVSQQNFHGHTSLNYIVKGPQMTMMVKTILKGDSIYMLSRLSSNSNESKSDYDRFINTFEFLEN